MNEFRSFLIFKLLHQILSFDTDASHRTNSKFFLLLSFEEENKEISDFWYELYLPTLYKRNFPDAQQVLLLVTI